MSKKRVFTLGLYTVYAVEISTGKGYARIRVDDWKCYGGRLTNRKRECFPSAFKSWGTVAAVVVFDDAGKMVNMKPLNRLVTIMRGDVLSFAAGEFQLETPK